MASRDWSWVYMQTNKYFTDQHVSQIEEFMKSLPANLLAINLIYAKVFYQLIFSHEKYMHIHINQLFSQK